MDRTSQRAISEDVAISQDIAGRATLTGGLVLGFGWWVWTSALGADERRWMLQLASGWRWRK